MFNLFLGDVFEYLDDIAKKYDPGALRLTEDNYRSFDPVNHKTVCASIGDVGHQQLKSLVEQAETIFYYPPEQWSDQRNGKSDMQQLTEEAICFASQYKKVINIDLVAQQYKFFNRDFCIAVRESNDNHIWAVGCSITHGVGVDHNQTWKYLVSKTLNLPLVDLSEPNSSIVWAADQICLADIKKDDIVFWGITSPQRFPAIVKDHNKELSLQHINVGNYDQYATTLEHEFPFDMLDSTTLAYQNLIAIRRVYNFCNKVGAKIVMLGLMPDSKLIYKYYNVPSFRQYCQDTTNHLGFVDVGTDGLHPGPTTHKSYADSFLNLYQKVYGTETVD